MNALAVSRAAISGDFEHLLKHFRTYIEPIFARFHIRVASVGHAPRGDWDWSVQPGARGGVDLTVDSALAVALIDSAAYILSDQRLLLDMRPQSPALDDLLLASHSRPYQISDSYGSMLASSTAEFPFQRTPKFSPGVTYPGFFAIVHMVASRALWFLLQHEIMHIMQGHLHYVCRNQDGTSTDVFSHHRTDRWRDLTPKQRRAMEWEADYNASCVLFNPEAWDGPLGRDDRRNVEGRLRGVPWAKSWNGDDDTSVQRRHHRLCAIAVALLWSIFAVDRKRDKQMDAASALKDGYPSLPSRMRAVFDGYRRVQPASTTFADIEAFHSPLLRDVRRVTEIMGVEWLAAPSIEDLMDSTPLCANGGSTSEYQDVLTDVAAMQAELKPYRRKH